jgi:hypothetical protein
MGKMELWNKVSRPPASALKTINGGRLNGMTDISPQWRYQILTEQFGVCGIGWKYEVVRMWSEPASLDQVFAFAEIRLYVKIGEFWSDPIPGNGGSMLVSQESKGLHSNDEGYKMAITDALGVACKMLGIGADIYAGRWDGSKYKDEKPKESKKETPLGIEAKNAFIRSVSELTKKIPPEAADKFRNDFFDKNHYAMPDVNDRTKAEFYYTELSTYVANFLKDFK